MIPLSDGAMSVGAVCRPGDLKRRKGRSAEPLFDTPKLSPALWHRVEHAELIDNEIRATGNYSCDSTKAGGAGWVLIGDAFAFLDAISVLRDGRRSRIEPKSRLAQARAPLTGGNTPLDKA